MANNDDEDLSGEDIINRFRRTSKAAPATLQAPGVVTGPVVAGPRSSGAPVVVPVAQPSPFTRGSIDPDGGYQWGQPAQSTAPVTDASSPLARAGEMLDHPEQIRAALKGDPNRVYSMFPVSYIPDKEGYAISGTRQLDVPNWVRDTGVGAVDWLTAAGRPAGEPVISPEGTALLATTMAAPGIAKMGGQVTRDVTGAGAFLRGRGNPLNEPGAAAAEPSAAPPTGGASAPPAASAPPPTSVKTAADAKKVASGFYKAADDAGGTLTPQFVNKYLDGVAAELPQTEAGKAVAGESTTSALVDRLQTLRDKPMTLQAAQEFDEALGGLIDKEYGIKGLSKEGNKLRDLQITFRNQIEGAGAGDITGGSAGFDAISQARKAWSQARKMDDLERIQARANLTDNPATSIRTQIRTLLTNEKKSRGYTDEELAALREAADRGVLGGALHVFGSRLIPLAAGAAETSAHGLTAGLSAAAVSHFGATGLRNWATRLQQNRLGNALNVVGQGVPPPPPGWMPPP